MSALKFTVMMALLAIGTFAASADQTNLVENVQIRLVTLQQGRTTTNRTQINTAVNAALLENRQVLQTLGSAMGMTFPNNARLVLITPLNGNSSTMQVRFGNNKVEVTGFFLLEQTGASVTDATTTLANHRTTKTIYSIQRFALQDALGYPGLNTHFDVSGLSTDFSSGRPIPGPDNILRLDVSGNGDRNASPLVITGNVTVSGQTLEVVADDQGGITS